MESWFVAVVSLCICALLTFLINFLSPKSSRKTNLPPGPSTVPIIGNFLWLRKSFSELEPILRRLHAKYGPVVTLRIGSRRAIFIADHSLAHQALIQNGAVFASRPKPVPTSVIMNGNQRNISSAVYGPTWRLLRRNLTAEILHPSRVKAYSRARNWVLRILIDRLGTSFRTGQPVRVLDHFQYSIFCLLVYMCFGEELDEKKIKEIETLQRRILLSFRRFNVLNFWSTLGRILFRNRWKELLQLRQSQLDLLAPLIRTRLKAKQERQSKKMEDTEEKSQDSVLCYADTLIDLELPQEKRKLEEGEMVSLCSEFLTGGTDTTSTALQWIMANLVKYPHIQDKLFAEISGVVGIGGVEEVKEEHLQEMPYLKAVILEGLRLHPPGHFVVPHAVTEEIEFGGYVVPEDASINFMVAEMGRDPKVWEDPLEFKPERFLSNVNGDGETGEVFDITGSREIKMMPFGVGRRICPGYGLALLHLEYFVANLIWNFEWKAVDGVEVDLSEKQEFTVVMKNPLQANLSPRFKQG